MTLSGRICEMQWRLLFTQLIAVTLALGICGGLL